jgi:hypothetical protein
VPEAARGLFEALAPVTFSDLDSAGLLGAGVRCWERDRTSLAKEPERLSGLAFQSPDRIEAWALFNERGGRNEASEGEPPGLESSNDEEKAVPLLALGAVPGPLGRLGLAAILGELDRLSGGAPLLLARASSAEIEPRLLEELGFERGAEHLLFGARAQAA